MHNETDFDTALETWTWYSFDCSRSQEHQIHLYLLWLSAILLISHGKKMAARRSCLDC